MGTQYIHYFKSLTICFIVFITMLYGGRDLLHASMHFDGDKRFPSVRLSLLSQRWRPQEKTSKAGGKASDVFEVGRDDLLIRFRLSNESEANFYYLAPLNTMEPTGYILFRKAGESSWSATSPARGREGSFTGGGYQWLLLPPGTAIEFEFLDLSTRSGEHAISLLVNTKPTHTDRIEYISAPYMPINQ
jgi:hypothetical protein